MGKSKNNHQRLNLVPKIKSQEDQKKPKKKEKKEKEPGILSKPNNTSGSSKRILSSPRAPFYGESIKSSP